MAYGKEIVTGVITLVLAGILGFSPLYSKVEANTQHREDSKVILMRLESKIDNFSHKTAQDLSELKATQKFLVKEYDRNK